MSTADKFMWIWTLIMRLGVQGYRFLRGSGDWDGASGNLTLTEKRGENEVSEKEIILKEGS